MNGNGHGRTEWDFWALCVKVGVPVGIAGVLFWFAMHGNMVAIIALVAAATVLLVTLGVVMVLAIMDRANAQEDKRFRANVRENLAIAEQMARLQNRQMSGLARQNRDLLKQAGDVERLAAGQRSAGGLDIDAVFAGWSIETVDSEHWLDDQQEGGGDRV